MLYDGGYRLVRGAHAAYDCAAVTMPCLAGMVVGLALLRDKQPQVHSTAATTVGHGSTSSIAGKVQEGDEIKGAGYTSGSAAKAAAKERVDDERAASLDLRYYIFSVGISFMGYSVPFSPDVEHAKAKVSAGK